MLSQGDDPTHKRCRFQPSDSSNPREVIRLVLDGQQPDSKLHFGFYGVWTDYLGATITGCDIITTCTYGRKHGSSNMMCGPARIYLNLSALAEQLQDKNPNEITYFGLDAERDQQLLVWMLREKCDSAYTQVFR